ncbi:unnamed protein product [Ectocarpus sp. 12 AP-2014]
MLMRLHRSRPPRGYSLQQRKEMSHSTNTTTSSYCFRSASPPPAPEPNSLHFLKLPRLPITRVVGRPLHKATLQSPLGFDIASKARELLDKRLCPPKLMVRM